MFICPICHRKFDSESLVSRHLLRCWREEHPYHRSKPAPRSEDIETRKINDEILSFFSSFQKE